MTWKINTAIVITHHKGKAKVITFHEKEAFLVGPLSKDCVIGSMLLTIYFIPVL